MTSAKNVENLQGEIDTTFQTHQRDIFSSGLVAQIGSDAFCVWSVIKYHADFNTGIAYPGIRRLIGMTGMSSLTVQNCIKTLEKHNLLKVDKGGRSRTNRYTARERLQVKIGGQLICSIYVDYKPSKIRDQLRRLKNSLSPDAGDDQDSKIFAEVEIVIDPKFKLDETTQTFKGDFVFDRQASNKIQDSDDDLALAAANNGMCMAESEVQIREREKLRQARKDIASKFDQ